MKDLKGGGPAFPVTSNFLEPGMKLRDWFAGQALIANAALIGPLLASSDVKLTGNTDMSEEGQSRLAYLMADAMLKAREAK